MDKKGFTLIELLAVIVIISLIMVLTIPNVMKISRQTKEQAYKTKIDMIEVGATTFGQNNKAYIMKGMNPITGSSQTNVVKFKVNSKGDITGVESFSTRAYSVTEVLADNTYRAIRLNVKDIVGSNDLSWDYENQCIGCANEEFYNNTIINPIDNYVINGCYIYIYYKYNNVYSYFDRSTCDNQSSLPNLDGREYVPAKN